MLSDIYKAMVHAIDSNERIIAKWKKTLDEHPLYAMHWSTGMFQATADNHVYKECLTGIDNIRAGDKPKEEHQKLFTDYVQQMALQKAAGVESSSSHTANLSENYVRAAWAKVARYERSRFLM